VQNRSLRIVGRGVKLSGMHEPPPPFHVAKIHVDGRTIECSSVEIRQLLLEAKAIGDDETLAQHFSVGRLMLIKDACQLHSLGRHQRLVKRAIDQFEHSASNLSARPQH
jgi:hypothetical protein